jgi:hypothetical protein
MAASSSAVPSPTPAASLNHSFGGRPAAHIPDRLIDDRKLAGFDDAADPFTLLSGRFQ